MDRTSWGCPDVVEDDLAGDRNVPGHIDSVVMEEGGDRHGRLPFI
jgi:hypothetical protein